MDSRFYENVRVLDQYPENLLSKIPVGDLFPTILDYIAAIEIKSQWEHFLKIILEKELIFGSRKEESALLTFLKNPWNVSQEDLRLLCKPIYREYPGHPQEFSLFELLCRHGLLEHLRVLETQLPEQSALFLSAEASRRIVRLLRQNQHWNLFIWLLKDTRKHLFDLRGYMLENLLEYQDMDNSEYLECILSFYSLDEVYNLLINIKKLPYNFLFFQVCLEKVKALDKCSLKAISDHCFRVFGDANQQARSSESNNDDILSCWMYPFEKMAIKRNPDTIIEDPDFFRKRRKTEHPFEAGFFRSQRIVQEEVPCDSMDIEDNVFPMRNS